MNPGDRKLYDSMYAQIEKKQSSFRVFGTMAAVKRVLPLLLSDGPEFFFVDNTQMQFSSGMGMVTVMLRFQKSQAEIRAISQRLEQLKNRFLQVLAAKQLNNRETVRYVHDFIIKNTDYAQENLMRMDAAGDVSTICGVFLNHRAVCMGIALAAKWLLDQAGIVSGVITGRMPDLNSAFAALGEADNHAWNIVNINDCWEYMDVTMDLGACQEEKNWVSYDYFLRSEENMKKYVVIDNPYLKCTVEPDSYFSFHKVCFSNEQILCKYLQYCAKRHVRHIYFQVQGELAARSPDQISRLLRKYILDGYRFRYNEKLGVYNYKLT